MGNGNLSSGELAARAGLNKETIRFYERKGLLPSPQRTSAGYRVFAPSDLDRLLFIKSAKRLGFKLGEIRELLDISDGQIVKCSDVKIIAENKLRFVNDQIDNLTKLKTVLSDLIEQCSTSTNITACPIIDSLSKGVNGDEN